jgi:multicomponent Na+:H+ antiporter subunit F
LTNIFFIIAIYLLISLSLPLYRLIAGPTVFDRVISAGLIGTNTTLLLVFIGFGFGRFDMLIDLAIVYALLNFMGIIVTSKYLERGRRAK